MHTLKNLILKFEPPIKYELKRKILQSIKLTPNKKIIIYFFPLV